jgi:hypothetical protein
MTHHPSSSADARRMLENPLQVFTPLPAPPPYDTSPAYVRVARIVTDDAVVHMDLLLGQLRVERSGPVDVRANQWSPFVNIRRIKVGQPMVFELAGGRSLVTPPVLSIDWLGPATEIPAEDIRVMRVIGTRHKPPRRWWQRERR